MSPSEDENLCTLVRRFTYFMICATIVWLPTTAQAVDCTAVRATGMPYQLEVEKDGSKSYPIQVFRGENLTRWQISIANNHLSVATFQANFQLENPGAHGEKIVTTYSVPTNKYIWTQNTRVVRGWSMIDGKASAGPGFEATYAMLPDAVVALGDCSFPVKHYTVIQRSSAIVLTSEVWFSAELNTTLRTTISSSMSSTGETTQTSLEAKSIDTKFEPLR